MMNFDSMFKLHNIMFTVIPIIVFVIFIVVLIMFISPKARGKMMSRQIKAMKHMVDYSKDDLSDLQATVGDVSIKSKKKVLDKNKDILKEMADQEAEIEKDAIKTRVKAVKDGWSGEESMYCKYCGADIDGDSLFCKKCGKKVR